jgi:hypothetical protein
LHNVTVPPDHHRGANMELDLSPGEATFLVTHLRRHLEDVEDELAHTEKHELQHELARDVELLTQLVDRFDRAAGA